ncbi:alpha/beta hydrolase [Aspergillus saccharolyticus JOP 1030-1]|uniref:Serine hydrolase domain-containing protein n=1 Tax=Aspergillus saccharolyticus JOP 1030-1 TaxID=1450539 RepID=A0A318Z799_9EURO|nr:hypothetical protein BP01DRAFT_368303 [Aspergillus saccharolyticus JOP 1030-1]PYH42277.1 hypothetical protein BP01DRAFT_368303 [Aspergillus saccharolyticus JOP 1030-1]
MYLETRPQQPPRTAKVLMLHGTGQSAHTFQAKMRYLHEPIARALFASSALQSEFPYPGGVEFVYLDGPIPASELDACDETYMKPNKLPDSWLWGYGDPETQELKGLEHTWKHLATVLNEHGPFVGVIGFSAGAAWSVILTALLEQNLKTNPHFHVNHPPLQFCIAFSAFMFEHRTYEWIYARKIQTPVLHFLAALDTWITERQSLKLVERCAHAQVEYFQGSHYIPRGPRIKELVTKFIQKTSGVGKELRPGGYEDWTDA